MRSARNIEKVWDLEDRDVRRALGLKDHLPCADKVLRYNGGEHAVIEDKGKQQSLTHAIEQLRSTIEQVTAAGTISNIKFAIAVKEKIPKVEKGLYRWDRPSHVVFHFSRPVIVANGLPLLVYTHFEAHTFGLV